jgi:hypothetical protein
MVSILCMKLRVIHIAVSLWTIRALACYGLSELFTVGLVPQQLGRLPMLKVFYLCGRNILFDTFM